MAEFKPYVQEQGVIFPPYLSELVPENHLARIINEIVASLELHNILKKYSRFGAEAYHPLMLLKILFYSYATGVFVQDK